MDTEKRELLYIQIRKYLKNLIDTEVLKPGDQIPTELELVNQFQVSRVTIKTALKHLVDEGLVFRIAGKGTFVTSPELQEAREELIKAASTRKIGFIMPPLGDMLSIQLLKGVDESCREEGLMLMIKSVLTQSEERQAIREMIHAGVQGLIIFPVDGEAYNEEILKLKLDQFPFVLVDRHLPGIRTNSVHSDNYQGGVIGTEHLIKLGHNRIGILSTSRSNTSSSEDRFRGYLDTARKHHLQTEPKYWHTHTDEISYIDNDFSHSLIYDWLKSVTDMTAVFCFNPNNAISVSEVARSLGKRLPEDLTILCFDKPQIWNAENTSLIWIEQNFELMGTEAVQLLLKTIRDPSTLEQIVIPVSLQSGHNSRTSPTS